MTDTEVTFLSCYNTVGHARVYVMALTSPPSLPLSRLWAELSGLTIHVITPPDPKIVIPLCFTLFSQRLLEVQKFDSECYHQSSHPHWDLVRTHKSRPLSPFHPHLVTSS